MYSLEPDILEFCILRGKESSFQSKRLLALGGDYIVYRQLNIRIIEIDFILVLI
jgi:hypothetical protein